MNFKAPAPLERLDVVHYFFNGLLFALLPALFALQTTERANAATVPQAAAPAECAVTPTIAATAPTLVSDNIIVALGDAKSLSVSDPEHSHTFELQAAGTTTVATGDAKPLEPIVGLPAVTTAKLLVLDTAGETVLCQRSGLTIVTFPSDWTPPTAKKAVDGTTTVASTFQLATQVASLSYNISGANISFDAMYGPAGNYRLRLTGQSTPANPNAFEVYGFAIGRDGNDGFGSGGIPFPIAADAPQSCPGFPVFKAARKGNDEIHLGAVTLLPTAVHFFCQNLSAGFDIQASVSSLHAAAALALSAQWGSGSPLIITGLSGGATVPIAIDKTVLTIQNLSYAGGLWTVTASIAFKELGKEASALATLSIAANGDLELAGGPVEMRLGPIGIQVQALKCTALQSCSGTIGVELPGFDTSQDQPFSVGFSTGPTKLAINGRLSGHFSGSTFTLNATGSIGGDTVILNGSGNVDIPSIGKGMALSDFKVHSDSAGLTVDGNVSVPSGVDFSLFRLQNITGKLQYNSAPSNAPGMTLGVTADGQINLQDIRNVLSLTGSVPGIQISFAFGASGKTTFKMPITGISFGGTFFGRRIEGGCSDTSKPFLTDLGGGAYDVCAGLHLTSGGGGTDVVDADLHIIGPAPNFTVKTASLSYGNSTQTTVQTVVNSKVDASTSKTTTTTVVPAANGTQPLRVTLGGKVLAITKVALRYEADESGQVVTTLGAPKWAHQCSDEISGSMSFDVQSVMNSTGTAPVEMTATSGFGTIAVADTQIRKPCFWFQADGTAGMQIAPNVSAVLYHAEFATYQDTKNQIHQVVHLEANGDLAYQNYTLAFKSIDYDDPGTGAKADSHVKIDTPNTVLKNVPAIATFLGALAARLIVK